MKTPQPRTISTHPFFALLIIAGITAPLSIMLHELGHFLIYRFFGYSPVLHFNGVSCGQPIQNASQSTMIIGAGVGLTLTLSLLSLVILVDYLLSWFLLSSHKCNSATSILLSTNSRLHSYGRINVKRFGNSLFW